MARVLFVDHSGEPGGAELLLLSLTRHMGARCHVVVMADGRFPRLLAGANIAHTVLPMSSTALSVRRESGVGRFLVAVPGAISSVLRLIGAAAKADVVYANTQKAFVTGAIAARIVRRPVVWHLHDILSEAHFSRFSLRLVVWLSKQLATRIITNSRATAEALIRAGGDAKRIRVIWNGIDSEPFEAVTDAEAARFRTAHGLGGMPLLGVFGRLAPWKGQHVMLEALRALPGVHALFVGEALYGEHSYEAALRRNVAEWNLADRVHFLGFRTDIPLLMRAVDVVVHTSTAPEPFGRVIVEGMMSGCPVIATTGGGPEEIVEDGITGILVPPNDSRRLAQAVQSLLEPTALRNRMVVAAQDRARQLFSLDSMLKETDELIREIAKED